ncbi:MAG TPA: calcineurin-like phosphoesterase C-terminal domain-containing protein [Opitutaceae bacterium]
MAPARRILLAAAAALAWTRVLASSGVVFDDRNGNGVRDPGEPGIASAEVSNGVDVAMTSADGSYQVPDRPGAAIFVIKPRGWRPPVDAMNLPRSHVAAGDHADFALTKIDEPDTLKALVMTDPQPITPEEVGYLEQGVVAKVGPHADIAFGVTLGDVVYDRPDLFGPVTRALARLGLPWYSVPGNHDLVLGTPDEDTAIAPFEKAFGPSTFAFHSGPALFIGLDDVRPIGGPRYVGGLREDQFQFIANLLRVTPRSEWVVLMMHIPIFSPDSIGTEGFRRTDRLRLFELLKDRAHPLILSGHTHYQRHVLYTAADGWNGAAPLHDYNVAAACGGFWGGPKDADGIPVSTMWDGTPPGYAVATFTPDKVSLNYFPARFPADHQISIHAPAVVAPKLGYVSFYANVFNGHDGWLVAARIDDRAWVPIRRIVGWDPTYAAAYLAQDSSGRATPGKRLPDPVDCYHLWRGSLPADLPLGGHKLEVRAVDPDGTAFTSEQSFEIANP